VRVRWLGRLPYGEAWDLQRAFHEGRVEGRADDDYLLLLEHPPTYTIGRNGDGSHLLVDQDRLDEIGAELFHVDRGGDITFHGPGQLVGYPIMALPDSRQIVPYVRAIETAIIGALGDLGIEAWPEEGLTGVWTEQGKVAAIGVRVAGGVSMHGFAVNLDPDLGFFDHINPCGLTRPVTSVSALLDRKVSHEEFIDLLVPRFAEAFNLSFVEEQRAAFARGTGREFDVDRRVEAGTFSGEKGPEPVLVRGRLAGEPERPEWMRVKAVMNEGYRDVKSLMRDQGLNTVCEEAGCPNIFECWESGTATLMLLGDTCTRACSFCDVTTGKPGEVDTLEPVRAADAVASMNLKHAVLTSVNRDDLPDGGAAIFAQTIEEIRSRLPECDVEVLIPDFKGDRDALETVMKAQPAVLNHNTETVLRLQRDIRTAANYGRSLALLARAKWINPDGFVKSGLIVGMGETEAEVMSTLADLRAVGVDIITIGQYLRPSSRHRPIDRYVHPDEFVRYAKEGERLGLAHVESGPLVRSSYHAREAVGAAK
jgi:lipoic acid synthetase